MNFESEREKRLRKITAILEEYLPGTEGFQRTALEAMNYSMRAGGKRLRPMLILETYRMFGGCGRVPEPFLAAIEMIHTYSLVHDDLPALDNDEYRRGRKTTHVMYGEAMAILAGDALLNYAYETAFQAFTIEPDNPGVRKALSILAEKSGIYGMLGGQCVDVESTGQKLERQRLDFIYHLKTGALIEASMMIGAVLAGASDDEVYQIGLVGADVGMAFQIQDDILDVTGTQEMIGKPVCSDERNEKTTYVTVRGIEQAREDVKRLSFRAVERLRSLRQEEKGGFLEELLIRLIDRKK